VLRRNPKHADALQLLGAVQLQSGRPELAAPLLARAVKANPRHAPAHLHLGTALWRLGRLDEALAAYDASIALNPAGASAHNGRGVVLGALSRPAEALASHEAAIALNGADADAHYNRGVQLFALRRADEAVAALDRAIVLNPAHAAAHNNLGTALKALGRPAEAIQAYDRAIALAPAYAEAFINRATARADLNQLEAALADYDQAIALEPANVGARYMRSLALLGLGRFEEGWREYEWRTLQATHEARRFDPARAWRGEGELAGKRLLVHHEQGLGDTLQFVRYAMRLADQGADFTLSVQPELLPTIAPALPTIEVVAGEPPAEAFDLHCPLMSLPLALGGDPPPAQPRRLAADPARRAVLDPVLGARTRPRIGLAWSGNPNHPNDHNRSIPFEAFAPLLSPEVDWIAVQDRIRPGDAAAFEASGVRFLGEQLKDFGDTAALLDRVDLVITVDTGVAHLAGAMGRPVWILLPFSPDWRWLLDRDDSPWHPTARLFRQPAIGDWASVVARVRAEIDAGAAVPKL